MQTFLPYYKTFLQRKYFRKQLVAHAEGKNEEKSVSKQRGFGTILILFTENS